MATLAEILNDPNYVNANAATKKAIFDRYAPQDPNYNKANAATQEAIRIKFGVAQPRVLEFEGMPGARAEPPRSYSATEIPLEAVKNLPSSAGRFIGGLYETVTSPVKSAVGLWDAAAGGLRNVLPTKVVNFLDQFDTNPEATQRAVATANAVGGMYKDRYGSVDALKRTVAEDPVGVAADLSTLLSGGAAVVRGAPAVTAGALSKVAPAAAQTAAAAIPAAEAVAAPLARAGTVLNPLQKPLEYSAPVFNKLAEWTATGAGKIADITQLPNQLAGRIARESLGTPEQIAAARTALQAAEPGRVGPLGELGQPVTAQQALARGGVIAPGTQATIEKTIKKTAAVDARAAMEASQEAARKSTIQGVTPDLEAAIKARKAAADPFYKAADKTVVPIDAELTSVLARMPEGTLEAAAKIAKMDDKPFIIGKTTPPKMVETGMLDASGKPIMRELPGQTAEITGESLHYIRRALNDIAYGETPGTGAGRDAQLAARGLLNDYIKVFEDKVPDYKQARQIFSEMSAPVNQAQVLREMVSVLEKPGGGERVGPFLNVLGRGEEAMLKRAGGRGGPRFESLAEVLTPEQLAKVKEVARQLETESSIGTQVSTGQQRATQLIKDELPNYRLPNIFNVLATTANKILDTLGVRVGEKTMKTLANASLSAKSFDELLATLPGGERIKVLKAIQDPATWAPLKPGAQTGLKAATAATQVLSGPRQNNLAPNEGPTNALVPPYRVEARGMATGKPTVETP